MPRLILPKTAFKDVKAFLLLEEENLRALDELFGSSASIAPRRPEFIREVAKRLRLDIATTESVVLVCQFLLTVAEEGNSPDGILNDLREFVAQHASPEEKDLVAAPDEKRQALVSLLTPKPETTHEGVLPADKCEDASAPADLFIACEEDRPVPVKMQLHKPLTLLDPDAEILASFEP